MMVAKSWRNLLLLCGFAILFLCLSIHASEPQLIKSFKVQDGKFVEKTPEEIPAKKVDDDEEDDDDAEPEEEKKEEADDGKPKESHVVILGKQNFTAAIGDNKNVLVEFYAPWCGHCKELEPEYEKLAAELKAEGSDTVIAKVDATIETDLAEEFGIASYPTLKLFKDGYRELPLEIDNARTKKSIMKKLKKMTDPSFIPPESDVAVLDRTNFNDFINEFDISLVEFYAPWCGHCKKLAPEYEKAATLLKKRGIRLAKIDATKEVELGHKYAVTGYPTFVIFRKGRNYKVAKSVRQAYEIEDLMIEEKDPVTEEVKSLRDFKLELDNNEETIVGLFKPGDKESQMHKIFMESSYDFRKVAPVRHSYDPKVIEYIGVDKTPTVVLYTPKKYQSKFEPRVRAMAKLEDHDEMKAFFDQNRFPLVGAYKQGGRYEKKTPLLIVFYEVDFDEHYEETQFWRQRLVPLAKKYKGQLTIAIGDDESLSSLMKDAGLDDTGNDINAVIYGEDGLRYTLQHDDEFSVGLLEEFIEKWKAGKVEAHMKSEKVPKKQKGAVVTVVGKTFKEIVFSETKDVLLELYAPWCGHCKSLAPIYEEFAQSVKDDENLVVAKMDATANDLLTGYSAEGFPTIYWRAKGKDSKPEKYTGDRTVEGFKKYVELQRQGYKVVDDPALSEEALKDEL